MPSVAHKKNAPLQAGAGRLIRRSVNGEPLPRVALGTVEQRGVVAGDDAVVLFTRTVVV